MAIKDQLAEEVVALGLLIGILTESGEDVSVNVSWFSDPVSSLEGIEKRLDYLVSLINSVLGPGPAKPPAVFPNASWYPIAGPVTGPDSYFYLVAPAVEAGKAAPSSGEMGLGVAYSYTAGNLTYTAYGYVPLLSYSEAGAQFIAGSNQNPCHLGLTVSTSGTSAPFEVAAVDGQGTVTFTALDIDARIYLGGEAPAIELEFVGLQGPSTIPQNSFTSLDQMLQPKIQPWIESWIGEVLKQGGSWLDLSIGEFWVSLGDILVDVNLLERDSAGNYTINLSALQGQTGKQIALDFVFGVLLSLSDSDVPIAIVEFPGGGVFIAQRENPDGSAEYGLRVALDFPTTDAQSTDGQPSTVIDLSFGSWLTGEDDSNNWVKRSKGAALSSVQDPGISIFMLSYSGKDDYKFAPGFALSSVGIGISGSVNKPLINLNGYTLQGAEVRAYLDSDGWVYGFAGRFDGLGFPLGPGFSSAASGSQTNPVAQSLLSSGSGGSGAQGDQDPVNPAFSASAAFMQGGTFVVQLYDKNGAPTDEVIIPIQRTLGPLRAEKLGVGWVQSNYMLSLLLDGGISLAGLDIELVGLSVGIPTASPTDFSKYDLDLNGLNITLSAGEVDLSAALIKLPPDPTASPPRTYTEYDGAALIQAGSYTVSAVGSYAYVGVNNQSGYTSLFVFGILDANVGGPAFFYVTGLAVGFGYNRALLLPDQASVPQFPLVAAASDPSVLGGKKQGDGTWTMPDPATALARMDQVVPPQRGDYWLAAGVRFTSFDLIYSTALLVVEFGDQLEIALLGISWMSLPSPSADGTAPAERYAYLELGIEMKLLPSQGVFSATGILTPNSFVIDPACKLTGGFAFYIWFGDNPHSGEFVFTLGGYNPDFRPPSHYPTVPKLGFNWPVSSEVTISGDAYFALTPSAVMAGAGLQVLYSSGDLRAWFKAQMDALIEWAPFHYRVNISVSLGASYRLTIGLIAVTFKVDLGASLSMWGPPTGGQVHVDWYVISFTVYFGASETQRSSPLEWANSSGTGFAQTLLPHASSGTQSAATLMQQGGARRGVSLNAQDAPAQPSGIYKITANSGLLKTFTSGSQTVWIVRPNHFIFSVLSAIPLTELDISPAKDEGSGVITQYKAQDYSSMGSTYGVHFRPMGVTLTSSIFTVTLTYVDENSTYDLAGNFRHDLAFSSGPAAKWGAPLSDNTDPEMNALIPGLLMGLENITPSPPSLTPTGSSTLNIDVESAFTYDIVDQQDNSTPPYLPLQVGQTPVGTPPTVSNTILQQIKSSIMGAAQVSARNGIFAALQGYGLDPGTNGSLSSMATDPSAYITGNPLLYQPPSPPHSGRSLQR